MYYTTYTILLLLVLVYLVLGILLLYTSTYLHTTINILKDTTPLGDGLPEVADGDLLPAEATICCYRTGISVSYPTLVPFCNI